MSIQILPHSNFNLTSPSHLPSSTHLANSCVPAIKKVVFNQKLKYGFCYSAKRFSESLTGLRKVGGLVGVVSMRCEMSEVEEEHDDDDGYYMRRCMELARKAIGHTSPNPMVGCVIVNDGKIVGEGFHPKAGQPHAEVFALRDAGEMAENGTAYVSLEPCNHYGRTPPCSEALINAKVKKVVVGIVDTNPLVASKGVGRLRDAGIEVIVGVEEELCKKLNEAFFHKMQTGKPFVTLRYSMSVDGHLLDQITDGAADSGGYYSKLLQEYDAIVFSSMLSANFSSPASKEPGANQPLQIVLSKSPTQVSAITNKGTSKAVIFTDKETTMEHEATQRGIEKVVLEKMNLSPILEYCKNQGCCNVLLDIRGNLDDFEEILREGFEQGLFQKFVVEVLPTFGGTKGRTLNSITQKLSLKNLTSKVSGECVLLEGYF